MRILVTGAAGFIGSHVTRALLSSGHHVVGLDDLSTGFERNLPHAEEGWRFVRGDIRSAQVCLEATEGVDAVVHLAARNSVPRSINDPRSAYEVNVLGSLNLMEAARAHGVKRFVYASSSSVYGDDPALPKRESQRLRPLSPYAASKAGLEHAATAWSTVWGLHTVGLRFFNVFGPRQNPEGPYAAVVPCFLRAAFEGRERTIHGDGSVSRDFTHVANVVHAIGLAVVSSTVPGGEVMNVACGGRVTVRELWEAIARETGAATTPVFGPSRPGDMPHSQADIGRARELLGYAPVIGFHEGIQATVAWEKQQRMGAA